VNKEELTYEVNQGNNLKVEGKQLDIVLTYFEGELRMLENWLINPRIGKEDGIIVAST